MRYLWLLVCCILCANLKAQITKERLEKLYRSKDTAGLKVLLKEWQDEVTVTPTEELNDTLYRIRQLYQEFLGKIEEDKYFVAQEYLPKVWIGDSVYVITDSTVMLSGLGGEKVPLKYKVEYLFQMGLFQGEDPEDRYHNAYFNANPQKRPSEKIIEKERKRYNERNTFINSMLNRNEFNVIGYVYFSTDLNEVIFQGARNEDVNGCFHYLYENNRWLKAPKNTFDAKKFKRNSCNPDYTVIVCGRRRSHNNVVDY